MLIITAITMIALVSFYIINSRKADPTQLMEPRASWPAMGVQIICGNCSGDEESPRKTYLDRYGSCAQCGGQSYMLASNRAVYAHQLRAARISELESHSSAGRVLPFNTRAARAEKIAV